MRQQESQQRQMTQKVCNKVSFNLTLIKFSFESYEKNSLLHPFVSYAFNNIMRLFLWSNNQKHLMGEANSFFSEKLELPLPPAKQPKEASL
ncbi:MAG: hypothetical protein EP343_08570 [Deltaproteobacteria bacterium]|nr:MAG: hypothetical protein EP343_08570 [Deltaproteobacteria bacterium]